MMGDKPSKLRSETLSKLSQDTKFTEDEITSWYRDFVKYCRDSKTITQEDFKRAYCRVFPQGDASVFGGHVFRSFDANSDGQMNFREFLSLVSVTKRGSADQKLLWVFKIYDIDDDGFVTRDEMTAIFLAMHKMAGRKVRFPSDVNTPLKRADKVFKISDKNEDDKISFEEFAEGATSDPLIAELLKSDDRST